MEGRVPGHALDALRDLALGDEGPGGHHDDDEQPVADAGGRTRGGVDGGQHVAQRQEGHQPQGRSGQDRQRTALEPHPEAEGSHQQRQDDSHHADEEVDGQVGRHEDPRAQRCGPQTGQGPALAQLELVGGQDDDAGHPHHEAGAGGQRGVHEAASPELGTGVIAEEHPENGHQQRGEDEGEEQADGLAQGRAGQHDEQGRKGSAGARGRRGLHGRRSRHGRVSSRRSVCR